MNNISSRALHIAGPRFLYFLIKVFDLEMDFKMMYSDPFTLWMRKLRPRKVNSQGKQLTGVGVRTQSYQRVHFPPFSQLNRYEYCPYFQT